jgi:predicted ATP-grasp superfamily ATP-dependent carboligase
MRTGVMALSGHNLRAVVALCRWAARAGVPVHLAARDAGDPIHLTEYAPRVFVQRRSAALDVGEVTAWIGQLCSQHGYEQVLIAPSTEFFNRFLLRHRPAIEAAGGIIPLVGEALYQQVSDKHAFAAMCAARGIPVPAVFDGLPDHLPFVAKPRQYLSASSAQVKPYLIFTPAERERFLRREAVSGFFFQEFVEGESLYLLAHIARSGKVTARAQENLMQQAGGGSIILARAHDFHLEAEARPYLGMLVGAGFHGLVMIEVRRCRRTGRAVMIEANPRMWGPLQFMLDQHADPFTPLFADHGIEVAAPAAQEPARPYYFWSGGLSHRLPPCAFHNFSPDRFVADYPRIAAADLFARGDTQRLHQHETAQA